MFPRPHFIPPVRAVHLGIDIGDHVHIYTFPMVASYVGGDIVAGILGSGIFQRETLTLYMDIGTNGEIVLGNKDWLASDSCSAGPAFEGAGIKFGMRATRGAIEEVSIHHRTYEPMIVTIGRSKPIGICGSGLIDAVAELLEIGAIDQNGKFRTDLPTDRIRKGPDGYEYVLARKEETNIKEDIVLTEIDIENLIRTKAAIYAGCKVLLESVGLGFKDLEQVIIAGGFGRHLDLEKAIFIGLLPELDIDKFIFVGKWLSPGGKASLLFQGPPEGDGTDRPHDDEPGVEQPSDLHERIHCGHVSSSHRLTPPSLKRWQDSII